MGTQADEVFPEAWHSDSITVSGDNVVITRSKVYLSQRLRYLRVNVIEAQDLVPLHGNRTNPEPFEGSLILSLEDKLGQKEECLGKCEIKLSQVERRVLPGPVPHMWYNLVGDSGGFTGRIHLRVSLDGGYHVLDESIQYSSEYRASAKLLWKPSISVLELGVISASVRISKMGEIQLAVRFSCTSTIYMLQKYSEPLLPEMHYQTPLSIYQLDSLRY
ncbi:unnamed protein product [Brassica oleracea]